MALQDDVSEYAKEFLPADAGDWIARHDKRKIIHDGLWGTFKLHPHEVALIDTPLFQRLRFIRQTGAVYLTYPSAVHTRFEHALGVMHQAQEMCSVFRHRAGEGRLGSTEEAGIRFAALMHDAGHGPFSHTSEQFFSALPTVADVKDKDPYYENCGAGEILSSMLVRSHPFREFVRVLNDAFKLAINCDQVSDIITGNTANDRMYLSEIIHGPFDADKLDYMHRDGMFSGLKMNVDLDRLFASIDIMTGLVDGQTMTRLVGSVSGITPLTQIMFNKMLLFTGMYHHHKVRAVDCMLWAIFDIAVRQKAKVGGIVLNSAADFLRLSDDTLLIPELTDNPDVRRIITDIRERKLWERALVISRRTVPPSMHAEAKEHPNGIFTDFCALAGNSREKIASRREISDQIWEEAGKPCKSHEVWLDVPKLPSMDEAKRMWIQAPGQPEPETLENFLPISQWVELYGSHKWQAHVFCPREHKKIIADSAQAVLRKRFALELTPLAKQYAGVSP